MKLTRDDFELIKQCVAIILDRKIETYTNLIAYSKVAEEEQEIIVLELKKLFELQNKLK